MDIGWPPCRGLFQKKALSASLCNHPEGELMNSRYIRTQNGFTSLEILGALVVFLMLLPVLASLVESGLDSMKKRAVADHLAKVADAASSYCKEHWAGLVASTSATTAASITLNQLRADGFLPSGFQNTNAWGQTYGIYALQPATGELQTVVLTTGGRGVGEDKSFLNSDVPSCAAEIGGAGGFIPTGDVPGQPCRPVARSVRRLEHQSFGHEYPKSRSGPSWSAHFLAGRGPWQRLSLSHRGTRSSGTQ